MTIQWDIINKQYAPDADHFGHLMVDLQDVLLGRGWTIVSSGDGGSLYSTTGSVFTNPTRYNAGPTGGVWSGSVAGWWSRSNAWAIFREPSPSTREIGIQRYSGSSTTWEQMLIRMSDVAMTVGGSSTVIRSSASAQYFHTTSTNRRLYSTAVTLCNTGSGVNVSIGISDSAKGKDVWPFFVVMCRRDTGALCNAWCYDSLVDTIAADPHPFVFSVYDAAIWLDANFRTTTGSLFQVSYDNGASAVRNCAVAPYYAQPSPTFNRNTSGPNFAGIIRAPEAYVAVGASGSSNFAIKGKPEHMKLNPTTRTWPDTLNLASADPYLFCGPVMIPWQQATAPLTT